MCRRHLRRFACAHRSQAAARAGGACTHHSCTGRFHRRQNASREVALYQSGKCVTRALQKPRPTHRGVRTREKLAIVEAEQLRADVEPAVEKSIEPQQPNDAAAHHYQFNKGHGGARVSAHCTHRDGSACFMMSHQSGFVFELFVHGLVSSQQTCAQPPPHAHLSAGSMSWAIKQYLVMYKLRWRTEDVRHVCVVCVCVRVGSSSAHGDPAERGVEHLLPHIAPPNGGAPRE
jgi:hypothetical protein